MATDLTTEGPTPEPAGPGDFDAFHARHRPKLLAYITRIYRCWGIPPGRLDPEDVVQEAMTDAWKRWATIKCPEAYTYTVARRRAGERADQLRSELRVDTAGEPVELPQPVDADPTHDAASLGECIADIDAILAELPPNQATATRMRHLGDASAAEIADELGIGPATANVHVYRGTAKLRKSLAHRVAKAARYAAVVLAVIGVASAVYWSGEFIRALFKRDGGDPLPGTLFAGDTFAVLAALAAATIATVGVHQQLKTIFRLLVALFRFVRNWIRYRDR
jgi:RNA polymerase sigma factor (sigma-70 family)